MNKKIKFSLLVPVLTISSFSLFGCNNNFSDHTHQLIKVAASDPTCTNQGVKEHFVCSSCDLLWDSNKNQVELKDLVLDKTGHNLSFVEGKQADCEHDGVVSHYNCSKCSKNYSDAEGKYLLSDTKIAKRGHVGVHHSAKPADCYHDGTLEYWTCVYCNKNFSDAYCTNILDDIVDHKGHFMTYHPAKNPTCEENGELEHYFCSRCLKAYSDEEGTQVIDDVEIPTTGHDFNDVVVKWSDDHSSAEMSISCKKCTCTDKKTVDSVITSRVEPTSTTDGSVTYKVEANLCGQDFSDTYVDVIPTYGATYTIKLKGDSCKIVNFTDVHLEFITSMDEKTLLYKTINKAVNESKPDLITFSGDQVFHNKNNQQTSGQTEQQIHDRNIDTYKVFCEKMDAYKTPYFLTMGNHDLEHITGEEVFNIICKSKYGHFDLGPTDIKGNGNYTVDILNKDNTLMHTIFLMDGGNTYYWNNTKVTYVTEQVDGVPYNKFPSTENLIYGHHYYDGVRDTQIPWYENEVTRINNVAKKVSNIESSVITHIPMLEFHFGFEAYQKAVNAKDEELIASFEPVGKCRMLECGATGGKTGFFDKIVELGSTKNVICGHDHKNDFSVKYQGVRLTYALKTSDTCYWLDMSMNGYTKVEIGNTGLTNLTQNYLTNL